VRITWDEALNEIAANLNRIKQEDGARSVAFCQGMPKGLEHFVLIRLANIFGSPNVVATQDVCHAPREISGFHTCGFYPVADFHHPSRLVVLWGSNITGTNEEGEICRLLIEQVQQGTELIIVDPRRTELTPKARCVLQIRPGSDHALALAWLNVIIAEELYDRQFVEQWTHGFEALARHVQAYTPEKMASVTWIAADQIRAAARAYAGARPAAIQWGNPIEQQVHTFDTVRALVCLMAVCGNLDAAGGNIQALEPNILSLGKFVRADLIPDKRQEMLHAHHGTIPGMMTVPGSYFKTAVLEHTPYPIRAAYMQCTNPLITYADSRQTFQALKRLDFLAVTDVFMTPTASLADIVLPAATHFEFNDIGHYGLGHGYILARPKVVDPPPACRPDMEILNELGHRLTSADYWFDSHEGFLAAVLAPSGLTYEQFVAQGVLTGPQQFAKYRTSGFRTPTGKVELCLSRAQALGLRPLPSFDGLPEAPDDDYPLVLTSGKDRYYLHSAYRWLPKLRRKRPVPVAALNPRTAQAYGLAEGDPVLIETRCGRITQTAHLTEKVVPGVVHAANGWWLPEGEPSRQYDWENANFNILTSTQRLGREFGTPNLKGINCRIRRA
jgi:anaerobic selenocysteine-containing dehydrogenase